jgi:hypothetical protein
MGVLSFLVAVAAVLGGVVGVLQLIPRAEIPAHLTGHPLNFERDLLSAEEALGLRELLWSMKEFPTNAADVKFYKTRHEHVGEAEPAQKDGTCGHPFLVPNVNRTACVLPGRLDVARHFIKSGGVHGMKNKYEQMISRVQSFGRYMFDAGKYPLLKQLFASEKFKKAARSTCPADSPHLDPFQFNFIMQVPGQSVAEHIDAPYFWGATRFDFPQWLLAAMTFSGMWQDKFVHQIQTVAYLHEWTDDREGDFVYWPQNAPKVETVPPTPRAGATVDGSKVIHAASIYRSNERAPFLAKDKKNVLALADQATQSWVLSSDGVPVKNYTWDDLRVTLVYRARCFKDAAEAKKFHDLKDADKMKLSDVLDTFQKDMVKRGVLKSSKKEDRPAPLDFALLISDTYNKYPLSPEAIVPFNYCAAGVLFPVLNPLLDLIC